MATGDDINVTLTWPVKGSVSAYITRLTGIPEGLRVFNDDLNTTSRIVDCLVGFDYHQETYYVDDSGTHWLKSKDFTAGQPEPPPTDLEVFALGTNCLSSSRNMTVILEGYVINSQYKDGTPVTDFNINGAYTATWNGESWEVGQFQGWNDEGTPALFNPVVNCTAGQYGIDLTTVPGTFDDPTGAISLGGSIQVTDPEDPQQAPTTGGSVSIKPEPR